MSNIRDLKKRIEELEASEKQWKVTAMEAALIASTPTYLPDIAAGEVKSGLASYVYDLKKKYLDLLEENIELKAELESVKEELPGMMI